MEKDSHTKTVVSIEKIFKAISDDKTLVLFNTIALTNGEYEIQINKLGLTFKQYYSRLSQIAKVGLIKRKNGRYILTALGMVVYHVQMTIGKALNYHWKLKAIESIQISSAKLSSEELPKLIDILIDDCEIRDILTKALYHFNQQDKQQKQQQQQQQLQQELNSLNLVRQKR
jgi:hypothetical protein